MTITKVLKLLPQSISEFQVGRLITRTPPLILLLEHWLTSWVGLCEQLASRVQSVRDSVRDTFTHMISTLGGEYLQFVLEQMESLLTRGYQVRPPRSLN